MPPRRGFDADVSSTLIDVFKIAKDAAESLEKVPYVKSVAGITVQVLQIREVCSNSQSRPRILRDMPRNLKETSKPRMI